MGKYTKTVLFAVGAVTLAGYVYAQAQAPAGAVAGGQATGAAAAGGAAAAVPVVGVAAAAAALAGVAARGARGSSNASTTSHKGKSNACAKSDNKASFCPF